MSTRTAAPFRCVPPHSSRSARRATCLTTARFRSRARRRPRRRPHRHRRRHPRPCLVVARSMKVIACATTQSLRAARSRMVCSTRSRIAAWSPTAARCRSSTPALACRRTARALQTHPRRRLRLRQHRRQRRRRLAAVRSTAPIVYKANLKPFAPLITCRRSSSTPIAAQLRTVLPTAFSLPVLIARKCSVRRRPRRRQHRHQRRRRHRDRRRRRHRRQLVVALTPMSRNACSHKRRQCATVTTPRRLCKMPSAVLCRSARVSTCFSPTARR